MGQVVARQHEALAGVVRLPEVDEEDVVLQAELDEVAERPAELQAEAAGALLDLLREDLLVVPEDVVGERDRKGEQIRAEIELAAEEARLGHIQGEQEAGEEQVDLLARAAEVEVEVIGAAQGEREVERVV